MKVSDILRVKGNTLYTVTPDEPLSVAVEAMAERDIGSLVVMEHGDLVGMLTFREVLACIVSNGGEIGRTLVRKAMEVEDPNIRLAKLESVCLTTLPYSEVWKKAREEAQKLRKEGARYW